MTEKQIKNRIPDFVRRRINREGVDYSFLPALAKKKYQELSATAKTGYLPSSIYELFDLLEQKTGKGEYTRPEHLRCYVEELQKSTTESIRCVLHAPAQHGKTTTTLVSLLHFALTEFNHKSIYVTYSQTRATYVQGEFCHLLDVIGIQYSRKNDIVYIKNPNDVRNNKKNSVMFTSVAGGITGFSASLIVVDDYIKSGEDASSAFARDKMYDWFKRVVVSRQSKQLSIVVMATRAWNDDLSGRLIEHHNYKYLRLAAICDDEATDPNNRRLGEPLWPSHRPLEQLQQQRKDVGEKIFELMWQGNTVTDFSRIFQPATLYYNTIGLENSVVVYGIDLAYTPEDKADWSAAVRIIVDKATGIGYVDDVIMEQSLYRDFFKNLHAFVNQKPGPIYWYASVFENKTVALDLKQNFPRAIVNIAIKSKYQRAGDTAKDWNNGFIRCPAKQSETMTKFIGLTEMFTGEAGGRDDGVDALVACWDQCKHIKHKHVATAQKTQKQIEFERKQKNKIGSNSRRRHDSF